MFSKNNRYWLALSLKSQLRIKTEQIFLETSELENDCIEVSQLLNYFGNLSYPWKAQKQYLFYLFIYLFLM